MEHIDNYFEYIDGTIFSNLFDNIHYPWDPLAKIETILDDFFLQGSLPLSIPDGIYCWAGAEPKMENTLYISSPLRLDRDISVSGMNIFLGEGTYLEPGALIKSPAVIGKRCQIRQCAYLRGNVIVGDMCVVGHTTEVKNSILLDHVEAGHFAYIGDSILGRGVNLGAGTKLANLQFRTREEKESGNIREIVVKHGQNLYHTGRQKLGAVIGDWCEIGCNAVTSPGVFLSKNSWVYPNSMVSKGFYPSGSILK